MSERIASSNAAEAYLYGRAVVKKCVLGAGSLGSSIKNVY